jgi:hypothetical protein
VFYLKPGVFKTVSDAIVDISTQIGIDIVRTAEHRESWRRVSPSERADAFYTWIGDPCNKDSLLVIDDLESFGESAMQTIREWPVWHIVISTRDSDLGEDDEDILKFRLERLGDNNVISILENRRNLLEQQDATLFRQERSRISSSPGAWSSNGSSCYHPFHPKPPCNLRQSQQGILGHVYLQGF